MEPKDEVDADKQTKGPSAEPSASEHGQLGLRMVKSEDLLQGQREVLVLHHGQVYRLRETRNGKLILGK